VVDTQAARKTRGYGLAPVAQAGSQGEAVSKQGPSVGGIVAVVVFAGIAIVALLTVISRQSKDSSAAPAKANTVVMRQIAFAPKTLTAAKGSTVVWENKDVAPHDVTADDPKISSGTIAPGKSFSLVVQEPFEYRCTIHPGMEAKIVLEG
jgi:plastocyanin